VLIRLNALSELELLTGLAAERMHEPRDAPVHRGVEAHGVGMMIRGPSAIRVQPHGNRPRIESLELLLEFLVKLFERLRG
jgi:hypothetical protein